MTTPTAIWSLLVAALLGFLIGLERERKREQRGSIFAGIHTFPLIALFGGICAQIASDAGNMVIVLGFAVLGVLMALAYWRESAGGKIGGTSEVAGFVTFGIGVLVGSGHFAVAAAGAVIATGILSAKPELRNLSSALSREDLYATVQFAAVSLVILPLVPNRPLGPWGIWNPHTIWLQVVLISGISFVGYFAAKVLGTSRSIGLGGILGGLVSSTAVTLAYSRTSKERPALSPLLVVGVLLASAVMVPRILILLVVVAPELVRSALPPFLTLFGVTVLGAFISYRMRARHETEALTLSNPFELKTALEFAVIFALVLLLGRAAQEYLGTGGVYLASAIAGLVRPDAMALTLGQQVQAGLEPTVAARALTLAVVANTLFKAGVAASLGSKPFGRALLINLLVAALAAVGVAWWVTL